jgi:Glycosyltransferase involved in LPS biosynthesis
MNKCYNPVNFDDYYFIPSIDSPGFNVVTCKDFQIIKIIADSINDCVAFNTFGQLKKNLVTENNFTYVAPKIFQNNGLYVKIDYIKKRKTIKPPLKFKNYTFYENKDYFGGDIFHCKNKTIRELKKVADSNPNCIAFNTYGYFKNTINLKNLITIPNVYSNHHTQPDGIYVRNPVINRNITIKPLWYLFDENDENHLTIDYFKKFSNNGKWNNVEFVNYDDADCYIIIDKPSINDDHNSVVNNYYKYEKYEPEKTILFKTNIWKNINNYNNIWNLPNRNEFLQIREFQNFDSHIWNINKTYNDLINDNINIKSKTCAVIINYINDKIIDLLLHIKNNDSELFSKINIFGNFGNKLYINDNKDYDYDYDKLKDKGLECQFDFDYTDVLSTHKYILIIEDRSNLYINTRYKNKILCMSYESLINDAFLSNCCIFYAGYRKLENFKNAYVRLDENKSNENLLDNYYKIIRDNISNDIYSTLIDNIKKSKNLILTSLQIFPTIEKIIKIANVKSPSDQLLNTYFDKIFVLNLDKASDRWECMQKIFKDIHITNYERFPAVSIDKIDFDSLSDKNIVNTLNKYEYACKISHYNMIKEAIKRGYKNILILEDDVVIQDKHVGKLNLMMDELITGNYEWDILYFFHGNDSKYGKFISNYMIKVFFSYYTMFYSLNLSSIDKMLKYITNNLTYIPMHDPIDDLYIQYFQQNFKAYAFYPNVISENLKFNSQIAIEKRAFTKIGKNYKIIFIYKKENSDHKNKIFEKVKNDNSAYDFLEVEDPNTLHNEIWSYFQKEPETFSYTFVYIDNLEYSLEEYMIANRLVSSFVHMNFVMIEFVDLKPFFDNLDSKKEVVVNKINNSNYIKNNNANYFHYLITRKGAVKLLKIYDIFKPKSFNDLLSLAYDEINLNYYVADYK